MMTIKNAHRAVGAIDPVVGEEDAFRHAIGCYRHGIITRINGMEESAATRVKHADAPTVEVGDEDTPRADIDRYRLRATPHGDNSEDATCARVQYMHDTGDGWCAAWDEDMPGGRIHRKRLGIQPHRHGAHDGAALQVQHRDLTHKASRAKTENENVPGSLVNPQS